MGIQNEEEVRLTVRVLRVSQRQHNTLSEGAECEPALTQNAKHTSLAQPSPAQRLPVVVSVCLSCVDRYLSLLPTNPDNPNCSNVLELWPILRLRLNLRRDNLLTVPLPILPKPFPAVNFD